MLSQLGQHIIKPLRGPTNSKKKNKKKLGAEEEDPAPNKLSDEVHFTPRVRELGEVLGQGVPFLPTASKSGLQNMLKYALCSYGPSAKYRKSPL